MRLCVMYPGLWTGLRNKKQNEIRNVNKIKLNGSDQKHLFEVRFDGG